MTTLQQASNIPVGTDYQNMNQKKGNKIFGHSGLRQMQKTLRDTTARQDELEIMFKEGNSETSNVVLTNVRLLDDKIENTRSGLEWGIQKAKDELTGKQEQMRGEMKFMEIKCDAKFAEIIQEQESFKKETIEWNMQEKLCSEERKRRLDRIQRRQAESEDKLAALQASIRGGNVDDEARRRKEMISKYLTQILLEKNNSRPGAQDVGGEALEVYKAVEALVLERANHFAELKKLVRSKNEKEAEEIVRQKLKENPSLKREIQNSCKPIKYTN